MQGKGLGGGVATGKVEHILVTDTGSCRCTACLTPAATAERGRERMSQREKEGRYTPDKTRQGRQAEGCHKYLCEFWEQQCRRRLMLLQLHMRLSKTVPHTHCLTRPPPPTSSSHVHTHSLRCFLAADNEQQDTFAPAAPATCLLSVLGFRQSWLVLLLPRPTPTTTPSGLPERAPPNGWRAKVDTTPASQSQTASLPRAAAALAPL